MTESSVFFWVKGKVQNVMFRQTIMRAAVARGVVAGATNNKSDRHRVDVSFLGPKDKIDEITSRLSSKMVLNSWGAKVEELHIVDEGIPPLNHEVNTDNFTSIKWKSGVEFYL